jgi:hypothetical protein
LVAHGEVKDARCGTFMRRRVKRLMGCLRVQRHNELGMGLDGVDYRNKVFLKRAFYSCHRPECPSCAISSWATREAERGEAILKVASRKYKMKIEHVIASSKRDFGSYEEMKKDMLKAALARGIVGGCYVYHHFRYHGKNETYLGEKPHYLKGQHFHTLSFIKGGYGNCRNCAWNPEKVHNWERCKKCNGFEGVTRRANAKDGWIFKVKDARKTIGGTLWYELSHCSIRKGAKKQVVVNWFGNCGRRKLKIRKGWLPQHQNCCKICGEKLYPIQLEDKAGMKKLLSYMSGFKDSQGFLMDAKDEYGNWRWKAVHGDRYDCG